MTYIARAISTIPKKSAKKTKETTANSTAVVPCCFLRLEHILKSCSISRITHRYVCRQKQDVLSKNRISDEPKNVITYAYLDRYANYRVNESPRLSWRPVSVSQAGIA